MPFDGAARRLDAATGAILQDTVTVVLHGQLAKKYGRRHQLHVRTAAEAAYALSQLHPEFRGDFAQHHYKVIRGTVATGTRLTEQMLGMQVGNAGEIHFVPAARGAAGSTGKGAGKMILGAVLLVVAIVAAIPTGGASAFAWGTAVAGTAGLVTAGQLAFFGAAVLLAGISVVISPQAKSTSNAVDPRVSFGLSGINNSTLQGTPVPVVYGRTRVGTVVGSFGFEAVDYVAPPSSTGIDATITTQGGTSGSITLVSDNTGGSVQGGGGGGKGGGSGGGSEAPNTLQSKAIIRVLDILSCGPIGGLVDGAKSIYFNNTPLMASDGSYNFQGVSWEARTGTPNQDPVAGYPAAEVSSQVGIQVTHLLPILRTVTSATANAARVTVRLPALVTQDATTGDLLAGPSTSWQFEVRPQGGNWTQAVFDTITGQKCTSPYQRSYRFTLPGAGAGTTSWDIRMTRMSPDDATTNVQSQTYWDALTVITDHQLIYPGIAYIALTIDASAFGSQVPTRSYEIDGILCQVPLNYDPIAHVTSSSGPGTSNGTWDGGSWKLATTSNPCWALYDMLSNARYGVGLPDAALTLTRYDLYTIAQYCDGHVPTGYLDGNGTATTELRYAMNVAMTSQDDAYRVLQSMVSSFRGMTYWGAGSVVVRADMPTPVSSVLNPANVINGDFTLEGTSLKNRHTVARVTWLDPQNAYQPTVEVVENFSQVISLGQVSTDISAFGVTSRGLARRLGKWLLDTEQTQTETMSCKVGLEHLEVRPGDVVRQTDPSYVGYRMGGRCAPGSSTTRIKLDSAFPTTGELAYFLTLTLPDGSVVDKAVVIGIGLDPTFNGSNNIATLQAPLALAPDGAATWLLSSEGAAGAHGAAGLYAVEGREFRILGVSEPQRGQFAIIAVNHDPNKFARIEFGLKFDPTPFSALNQLLVAPLPPPSNVTASDYLTGVGTTTVVRATCSFSAVRDPRITGTEVRALGPETRSTTTNGSSVDFDNLALGSYTFGARSVGRDGRASIWVNASPIVVDGLADAPVAVTGLTAIGGAMQVVITWQKSIIRDLLQYEVWRAPAPGNGVHPFNIAGFVPSGTPASNGASLLAHIDATTYVDTGDVLGPDLGWAYWVRAITTTQVAGTFAGPVKAVTTVYLTNNLADAIKNTAPIANALLGSAPIAVQTLAGVTGTEGQLAFQASDQKLYRWDHNANSGAGGWVRYIAIIPDSAGKIPASIVSGIADAVIGSSLTQAQINQVLNAVGTQSITDSQIASVSGSKVSGTLSNAQLPAGNVYEVDPVSGQAVLGINTAKLIGTINASKIVDVDPVTGNPVTGVSAAHVVGTINAAQIPNIPTSKLLGTISALQIGPNSVTTGSIAANAVTATALAAGAVTAEKIAVGSSTNVVWNASCVISNDGWAVLPGISTGISNNLAGYTPVGEGCGYVTAPGQLSNGGSIGAVWVPDIPAGVPVIPGAWVEAQALLGAHRVAGFVVIDFYDATGASVPSSRITSARMVGSIGGTTLSAYALVWCKGQAPAGAATMRLGLLGTYDGNTDYGAVSSGNYGFNPYLFWCRAVIGLSTPVPMAQSTPQPYAPGGITEITGGVVKTGTIVGRNILAGAITTDKLSVGGGGNVIWNSCCAISTDGWSLQQTVLLGTLTTASVARALKGFGAGELYVSGSLAAGQVMEAAWSPNAGVLGIAATAGQAWEAQALIIGAGCQTQLVIDCFDSAQNYLSTLTNATTALTPGSSDKGTFLGIQAEYTPLSLIVTLPVGTAFIRLSIRMVAPSIAAGAQVYFTQVMLAQTIANATQISTWSPGGLSQITGGLIQTDAISSRQIAANAITTSELAVGGSANMIANSCLAVTTEGWNIGLTAGSTATLNSCASTHLTYATKDGAGALDFTLAAGGYVDIQWQLVSVNPGDTLCLQAMLLPIGAGALVYGEFVNADGSHNGYTAFSATVASQATPAAAAQGTLAPFTLAFVNSQVPAGAAGLAVRIRVTSAAAASGFAIFTRTGVGPTVVGATQVSPWAPGGVTQITAGLLQTNAVVARVIAAGAISADKLQIASSANVIGNPTCPSTSWGWVLGYSTPATTTLGSVNGDALAPTSFALTGEGTGCVTCTGTMASANAQYMLAAWDPDASNGVACLPGEWWEGQAYIGTNRCWAYLDLSFWTAAGVQLSSAAGVRVAGPVAGTVLSAYGLSWTKALAPATAARVLLRVIAYNDGAADIPGGTPGTNPFLFFTRAVLGRSTSLPIASGALPQPYQIGGVTQVSGGQIKTGTIVTNNLAAGAVTANKLAVGSATNVIWNGCAYPSTVGWLPLQADFTLSSFAPDTANFGLTGYGSGYMNMGTLASAASRYIGWSPNAYAAGTPYGASIPCNPGEIWEAQALIMGHRCSVQIYLKFLSATAELLSTQTVAYTVAQPTDGKTAAKYTRASVRGTAPAGTTVVTMLLLMVNDAAAQTLFGTTGGNAAGTNPYLIWSQAGLGPVVSATMAQPLPWSPGGVTSISGGVLQTGTIIARHMAVGSIVAASLAAASVTTAALAAGSVTAAKLTIGTPTNCIWNPCCDQGTDGWVRYGFGTFFSGLVPNGVGFPMDAAIKLNANWYLTGFGSAFTQYTGSTSPVSNNQGFVWDWSPTIATGSTKSGVPATSGAQYGGSVLFTGGNNATAYLTIVFIDFSNNVLASAVGGFYTSGGAANGLIEDYYQRATVMGVAPAGTCFAIFRIVVTGSAAGAVQPYIAFSKAMFGQMDIGATAVGQWTPGGITTISGGMIKTGTLDAAKINAGTVAAATGFIATLTATLITATNIKAQLIGTNRLDASEINADTLTAGAVKAGAIGSDQIAANALHAYHLASDFALISSAQIGFATIATLNVGDLQISGSKIGYGAVSNTASVSTYNGNTASSTAWSAVVNMSITKVVGMSGVVLFIRSLNDFSSAGAGLSSASNDRGDGA